MTWLDTAADEAWAQGQISRYPGWYSQCLSLTPSRGFPRVLSSTTASTAMLSKAKRPVEIDDESLNTCIIVTSGKPPQYLQY